ncbi:MAG: CHASE3 domain-containing protein, partial [Bacteroidota bacterium]|nr:CHASE3 domain-containing protein [Bacteroidota bacterium]
IGQLRQQFQDNPAQQERVDSIHFYMQKRLAFSLQQAELRSKQGLPAAIAYASTNHGLNYSDNLRQISTAVEQHEEKKLKQLLKSNKFSVTAFNWISRIMFVLISVTTILLLIVTGKNLQQNEKREKRAAELIIANEELAFQNTEKENRAAELILANKELVFQNEEKGKRAAELIIADKELVFQNEEKEKQEAVNKELEAFSYSVSHDLRAPLRHIGGFVDLLIKNNSNQLDEKGLRYLNIISESSNEMGNLIDALLTFSRLSRIELKKTKINSQNMVTQVLKSYNEELAGHDVEINVSELPDTTGDETLIHQVWENLISNAFKYSRNKEKAKIDIG